MVGMGRNRSRSPFAGLVYAITLRSWSRQSLLPMPISSKSLSASFLSAGSGFDVLHDEHRTAGVVHHIVAHAAQQDLLNA